VTYSDAAEQRVEKRAGIGALFSGGLARDTLATWAAFFMCLTAVYSAFSWLPTMLASEGLSMAVAGSGLTAYNLGGVIGALVCAVAITRFGSRWPLVLCCAGAAASAFALQSLNVGRDTNLLIFGFGVHGMFVNAVQSTMYALCAFMYPTSVRATGTASALAFGRLGAILSAFAGAAVITAGGAMAYLTLLGSAMVFAMIALLIVRRHIPRRDVLLGRIPIGTVAP
jgi:AAHS family 4-hydroxybenzoate transporter-like MFS transporter